MEREGANHVVAQSAEEEAVEEESSQLWCKDSPQTEYEEYAAWRLPESLGQNLCESLRGKKFLGCDARGEVHGNERFHEHANVMTV